MTAPDPPSWDEIRRASVKPTGYPYTRYVNRYGGRYIAFMAARIGATPNVLSVVSALLTLAAATLIVALGSSESVALVIYICLAMAFIFDSADGQLARASGRMSPAGGFLDHSMDGAKTPLSMATIGLAYHLHATAGLTLGGTIWPGIALLTAASWSFTITWQKDAILKTQEDWVQPSFTLAYIARAPFDYGVVLMWIPALVLIPSIATVGFQLFVPVYVAFVIGAFVRSYRRIEGETAL
jgi:phosphatidylglycerophosphate synthase